MQSIRQNYTSILQYVSAFLKHIATLAKNLTLHFRQLQQASQIQIRKIS